MTWVSWKIAKGTEPRNEAARNRKGEDWQQERIHYLDENGERRGEDRGLRSGGVTWRLSSAKAEILFLKGFRIVREGLRVVTVLYTAGGKKRGRAKKKGKCGRKRRSKMGLLVARYGVGGVLSSQAVD